MNSDQVKALMDAMAKQSSILEAIASAQQKQCEFLNNIQNTLVVMGMQLMVEGGRSTLAEQVDSMSDAIDEIKSATVDLADAFAENKKGNVASILCDIAADTEHLRDYMEAKAAEERKQKETGKGKKEG